MLLKIKISGKLELVTGMHIGAGKDFSAIGAVDSAVVRDPISKNPIIPGSSLKGKLRYLLSRKYNDKIVKKHSGDGEAICRLFGSSEKEMISSSRIIVSDMFLENDEFFKKRDIANTEVKFENTIDRYTAVANPRQIERSIKGSVFPIDIIYTSVADENEVIEDLNLLKESLELLKYDYIGGHGSRGYGRVKINDLKFELLIGEIISDKLEDVLKGE